MVGSRRAPATRCAVSSAAASDAGGRRVARNTRPPTPMWRVAAATAPRSAGPSSEGRRSRFAFLRKRWSYTKTPSRPAASAAPATRSGTSGSRTNDGSVSPTLTSAPSSLHHLSTFSDGARERGGADDARELTELGGHDRDRRPVRRALDAAGERAPQRLEQQLAEIDQPARHHDQLGIEDVHEAGEPERDVRRPRPEDRQRVGVTR